MTDFEQTENEKYLDAVLQQAFGSYTIVPDTHENNGTLNVTWLRGAPDFTDYSWNMGEALLIQQRKAQADGAPPVDGGSIHISDEGLTVPSATIDQMRTAGFLDTLTKVVKANGAAKYLTQILGVTLPENKGIMQLSLDGTMQTAIRYADAGTAQTVAARLTAAAKETGLSNLSVRCLDDTVMISSDALTSLMTNPDHDQQVANLTAALIATPAPTNAVVAGGQEDTHPIDTKVTGQPDGGTVVTTTTHQVTAAPNKGMIPVAETRVASLAPTLPVAATRSLGDLPANPTRAMPWKERKEGYIRNREVLAQKLKGNGDLQVLEQELHRQIAEQARQHHRRPPRVYKLLNRDGELNVAGLQADLREAGYKSIGTPDGWVGEKTWKAVDAALQKLPAPHPTV